ncbi:MAG: hypothetical protein R3C68_11660 [Myxococcota bacterium]
MSVPLGGQSVFVPLIIEAQPVTALQAEARVGTTVVSQANAGDTVNFRVTAATNSDGW